MRPNRIFIFFCLIVFTSSCENNQIRENLIGSWSQESSITFLSSGEKRVDEFNNDFYFGKNNELIIFSKEIGNNKARKMIGKYKVHDDSITTFTKNGDKILTYHLKFSGKESLEMSYARAEEHYELRLKKMK